MKVEVAALGSPSLSVRSLWTYSNTELELELDTNEGNGRVRARNGHSYG